MQLCDWSGAGDPVQLHAGRGGHLPRGAGAGLERRSGPGRGAGRGGRQVRDLQVASRSQVSSAHPRRYGHVVALVSTI